MTVQPMSVSTPSPAATPSASNPANVTEDEFLQLLVAQLQHQDPTNPTDGTTFVTQLAQFSQLEQLIAIRSDIESPMAASAAPSSGDTQGGT
jgi:flagellar basal-body rod modification protein FlgD